MNRHQLVTILGLSMVAIILFMCGCEMSEPKTDDYEPSCKVFVDCIYLNQKNPDKTICSSLADGCKSANDFKACLDPILKDNKMDFKDCLLLMRK